MPRSDSYVWIDPEELLEPQETPPSPEQLLWLEVVRYAISEACGKFIVPTTPSGKDVYIRQARAFIHTDRFRHVCELAGLDAEPLRARVLERMKFGIPHDSANERPNAANRPPHIFQNAH
jgi:hypothetical protein